MIMEAAAPSIMFTTVEVTSPRILDGDYSQTHEVSGSGALSAVTLNLERELGRDGKKVSSFTIKVNFLLPKDSLGLDNKESTISEGKNSRWTVVDSGDFVDSGLKGSISITLKQRTDEGYPVALLIHLQGHFPDGEKFHGALRIRIVTTDRDLSKPQRDKP